MSVGRTASLNSDCANGLNSPKHRYRCQSLAQQSRRSGSTTVQTWPQRVWLQANIERLCGQWDGSMSFDVIVKLRDDLSMVPVWRPGQGWGRCREACLWNGH